MGKSTLFNRLIENNQAIVSAIEGTTRDSNLGDAHWQGRTVSLIDSGGIIDPSKITGRKSSARKAEETEDIDINVQKKARDYITRADLVLLVVDARSGLLPADSQLASLLKKTLGSTEKILLVANKADKPGLRKSAVEFTKLGLGEPLPVSAATGSGTGDLLDVIIENLYKSKSAAPQPEQEPEEFPAPIPVSIIGKPNVGKSSLANKLLGEDRIIISSVPHTTREPQDIHIEYQDRPIKLVDTAGISRKGRKEARHGRIKHALEKISVTRSLGALRRSDIALLVIDITESITQQESKLVQEILESKNSLVIVANKWDLIKEKNTKKITSYIHAQLPFVSWAPIIFISAKTGEKINNIPDVILKLDKARKQIINENYLSRILVKMLKKQTPRKSRGAGRPYIHTLKQAASNPPVFEIRIGSRDSLSRNYLKFMENYLRKELNFLGTPITIRVIKGKNASEKK